MPSIRSRPAGATSTSRNPAAARAHEDATASSTPDDRAAGRRRCAGRRSPRPAPSRWSHAGSSPRRAGARGPAPSARSRREGAPSRSGARLLRSSARWSAHPPAPVRGRRPAAASAARRPTAARRSSPGAHPASPRRPPGGSVPPAGSRSALSRVLRRSASRSRPSGHRPPRSRWTGVAPRHRGNREKCRLIAPNGARLSVSRGRIWPYATTTITSGAASASAVAPGPSRTPPTSSIGAACAVAAFATAVGVSAAPRPTSFGGFVTTSASDSSGSAAIASSDGTDHGSLPGTRPKRHRRRIVADARARPTAVCAGAAQRARVRSGGALRAPRGARRRRAGRCTGCR